MYTRLFSLCLLLASTFTGYCQNNLDSLLKIAGRNEGDAASFYTYKQLGKLMESTNPKKAITYYRHTIEFPFRTSYEKDFVEACNALGKLYLSQSNYDSSIIIYEQSAELAKKFHLLKELVIANQGIAQNYLNQSAIDTAKSYFDKALKAAVESKDQSLQAGIFNNLGNVALEELKYSNALDQFINAAKIYERINDQSGLGKALANIGNIENILGQYDKALDYTLRALKIFEATGEEKSQAYCHRLIGRIYRKQKNPDKAIEQYQKALVVYQKMDDPRNESETFQSIGNIYFDLKKYQAALIEFKKSITIAKKINSSSQLAYSFSGMGNAFYNLKKNELALAYFDSSIMRANEVKNGYLVMDAYELKSEIYETQNNYKDALKFHRLFVQIKDSIEAEENKQVAQELEAKYESSHKQTEITLLKKNQQLQNVSLTQSRTLQTALIITVVLLLIIGFLVLNRNKVINHAKRQMEIERVRNQIARDLHDDMGSTLSSINLISQVAIKDNSIESKSKYFQKIGEQSAKIMESMSDLVWSINPDNDSFQKAIARMKEFCGEILEPKNIAFVFEVSEPLYSAYLDVAKRKNLFLIFKEAVNNCAKYSEATFLHINFSETETGLEITIRDNGKGFDSSNSYSGNGLRNMQIRAKEMNATLKLESVLGSGTVVQVDVTLT